MLRVVYSCVVTDSKLGRIAIRLHTSGRIPSKGDRVRAIKEQLKDKCRGRLGMTGKLSVGKVRFKASE